MGTKKWVGKHIFFAMWVSMLGTSCKTDPKTTTIPIQQKIARTNQLSRGIHNVEAIEVLPANNYVYMKVRENGRQFWIATRKREIEQGNTYIFSEALIKTNFESKEHNRVFDTLYMVTELLDQGHLANAPEYIKNKGLTKNPVPFAGAIKISQLLRDPKAYEGKIVELSGTCTKVNPAIMNRNWVHFKDGSQDDFDLVITSKEEIKQGETLKIRGIVTLNKDFGSGYAYDVLLEEGRKLID